MADILAAVKAVQKDAGERELALREVSRTLRPAEQATAPSQVRDAILKEKLDVPETPEQSLQVLKGQPGVDLLLQTLERIRSGLAEGTFNIQIPGPRQAQIINTIVSLTVPDFWPILDKHARHVIVECLTNFAGLGATVARLRLLSERSKGQVEKLAELYSVAKAILHGDDFCFRVWNGLFHKTPNSATLSDETKRQIAWKEFVSLIASGKVVATIAQVEDRLKDYDTLSKTSWMSNGSEYAAWLGRNILHLLTTVTEGMDVGSGTGAAAAQLMCKAFTIGYPVSLVRGLMTSLVSKEADDKKVRNAWTYFMEMLPTHIRRQLLESILLWLSTLADDNSRLRENVHLSRGHVAAFAALLALLCGSHESMTEHLAEALQTPAVSSSVVFDMRRASIAYLSDLKPEELNQILGKLISTFGDQLFINHAPVLQQESVAQTILLCAGRTHRIAPGAVLTVARSSRHMQGVSNRLDSTNQKARWLGMVVATALSRLVDDEGLRMDFGTEDMLTKEASWYLELIALDDHVGTLGDLHALLRITGGLLKSRKKSVTQGEWQGLPILNGRQTFGPPRPPRTVQPQVIGDKVTEIVDCDDEEDEDLKQYAKPDSDPEDSDEDATLVNRNKVKPPVYVRDLMRMLKDDKNHDRFQMALQHAPALIRRKANFGAEVRDHAEELALMLCDLQDPYSTDDFDELRLQALIAVLLSNVKSIAPWLSKQAFIGDYGLGQRCIMLSALGLGGRELAGLKSQDELKPSLPESATLFPSKKLSDRLHAVYSPADTSVRRLHAASETMKDQLIKPIALSAADKTTSHLNAVKVRTFSSRMDVERTKQRPAANELAKVFGSCFFFPLAMKYEQEVAAYGARSVFISAPFVLVTFLKTLALLLNASGPATAALSEITTVFWDIALSLRVQASADLSVLEAVLFCLLTILDVNGNGRDRIAQENAQQLTQTQQWVDIIFEKVGGGEMSVEGSADEMRVRTLAAGVLVKISEVLQERQTRFMGNLP